MDDSFCFRALYAIRIYVRHNIMTHLTFTFLCNVIIDILCMCLQFINLLLCNQSLPERSRVFSMCGISYPGKKYTAFLCWHNVLIKDLHICLYSSSLSCFLQDIIFNPFISLLYVRFSQPRTLKLYNIIPLKATTKTLSLMEFTKKFFHSRMF